MAEEITPQEKQIVTLRLASAEIVDMEAKLNAWRKSKAYSPQVEDGLVKRIMAFQGVVDLCAILLSENNRLKNE